MTDRSTLDAIADAIIGDTAGASDVTRIYLLRLATRIRRWPAPDLRALAERWCTEHSDDACKLTRERCARELLELIESGEKK